MRLSEKRAKEFLKEYKPVYVVAKNGVRFKVLRIGMRRVEIIGKSDGFTGVGDLAKSEISHYEA